MKLEISKAKETANMCVKWQQHQLCMLVQVLQELDERVQRMNEEHRRDARRRAEELVQPLLAPDFFSQ